MEAFIVNDLIAERVLDCKDEPNFFSISCPSLVDQLDALTPESKAPTRTNYTVNSSENSKKFADENSKADSKEQDGLNHYAEQQTKLTSASQSSLKKGNRFNLVKQRQTLKCYQNQRKSKYMGELCPRSNMSQSGSAMSNKQQTTQKHQYTEKFEKETNSKKEIMKDKKNEETKYSKDIKQQAVSDANNNTGSVKILVNDITLSNSQEFLQQRNSTPNSLSSQTTSFLSNCPLMQQSQSISDLNNVLSYLTKRSLTRERLIKNQQPSPSPPIKDLLCYCAASNVSNLSEHKTIRRSWSFSSAKPPFNTQIEQNFHKNYGFDMTEKFDRICSSRFRKCLDQKTGENSLPISHEELKPTNLSEKTKGSSESDCEETSNIEHNSKKDTKKEPSIPSNIPSPAISSASSLCVLEISENLSEADKNQLNTTNQQLQANQKWYEKPRSLSASEASSTEAFYYQQRSHHSNDEILEHPQHLQIKPSSANQSLCCCYNTNTFNIPANAYSRSNSGSSSHDSVSQLSVSTSSAAISSIGSILSTTPLAINQGVQQFTPISTTPPSLISRKLQKITSSIASSYSIKSEQGQRSRSATGCLYSIADEQPSTNSNRATVFQQPNLASISPATLKQTVGLTKSDQETKSTALRHAKSQKQPRQIHNRLTNEATTPETVQSNRSMRSRNQLLLAHQLHKSLSTPTLIVHEEQTAIQTSERSSALSRIRNKFTGNSSNSNISAIKSGLFSTVRDKLLQHENLALTCTPDSDDERGAKPKKRASLFFRKKKTKDTARKSAHQFVSVSYSIAAACDVCSKTLANKDALHCENCLITVHDSTCKDQILDCNRFSLAKKPNQLTLLVPDSSGNLISNKAASSTPTHSEQILMTSGLNESISSLSATVNQTVSSTNLLSNLSGMANKQFIETGSAGYATPLAVTPATSPSSSYSQLHPPGTISLNPVATSSFRKGHHPSASIGSFSSSDSSCSIQPKANPSLSPSISRKSYTPSALSQWRRVRTKLGVNKVICEDKEAELTEDNASIIVEVNSTSSESLEEPLTGLAYSSLLFEDDQIVKLRLSDDEPASWSSAVQPNLLKNMKENEIKRQEAIYELILTEKHHCLTMKIMQKVFAEGMLREVNLPKDDVERIFPCLEPLLDFHLSFLRKLRERQTKYEVVPNISDILLVWFSGKNAEKLRNYYGQFCSQHKEAVFLYKDYLKTDRKFQSFIKSCMSKPYCKTRGVIECLLLVTQRISKYPLIIESLIKLDKTLGKQLSLQLNQDEKTANLEKLLKVEISELDQCYVNVRQIIFNVDDQVAEKEREHRLLKIYNKIDVKSTATVNGKKFRKSDLLSDKRKLQFETMCTYRNPHSKQSKSIDCLLIILSDVIVFLQENNQKYHFAPIDNKSSVISLTNLIVREKAGQSSKGIFLISTNKNKEEMYELHFGSVKDQKQLIGQLNYTIALSQFEATNNEIALTDNALMAYRLGITTPTCRLSNRRLELNELINELHQKDKQLAAICEDKIRLLAELLEMQNIVSVSESAANLADTLQLISYSNLVNDTCSQENLLSAANEAYRIVKNLYLTGCNLSRSVSSAGEHQSDQFINPPTLPKRAETFGGFDTNNAALARLLQKFTSSANNIISTTITTCSPSTVTTNTVIDKLVQTSINQVIEKTNQQEENNSSQSGEKRPLFEQEMTKSDYGIRILNAANSPTILVNTVLPMQDPNDLVEQFSTLPLLVSQLEHSRNSVDSEISVAIPQSKHEQVIQIVELQHQLNLLLCLFHHQQTLFELMRLNLQENANSPIISTLNQQNSTTSASTLPLDTLSTSPRTNLSSISQKNMQTMHSQFANSSVPLPVGFNKKFRAENQLEELRNLNKLFSAEKQSFEIRTRELDKREAQLKQEKEDLVVQRENLNRKLENIQDELRICISSSGVPFSVSKLANLQASLSLTGKQSEVEQLKSSSKTNPTTRTRLSSGDIPIKQQKTLKLATDHNQLSSKSCCNSPNNSPAIKFNPVTCLQSSSANYSMITSSKSTTTSPPSKSFEPIDSKESDQSSTQNEAAVQKDEEEIFC